MKTITEDGEVLDTVTDEVIGTVPPFWKTPYNHDRDSESNRTGFASTDPSKTQQSFAAEADINNILAKFLKTGELNITGHPTYQDVPEEFDLQNAMVTAYQVEQAWNELPTAVRNILKDPRTFADYVDHCLKNGDIEPLRELGLAKPSEPPTAAPEPPKPATPMGGSVPPIPPVHAKPPAA